MRSLQMTLTQPHRHRQGSPPAPAGLSHFILESDVEGFLPIARPQVQGQLGVWL